MQQPCFRVAMIGGGLNSAVGRVHEIALKMDNRFTLVAGCFSRNPEVNRNTGQAYGVDASRVYDDPAVMLRAEAGQLDAVVVVTPILAHEEHIHLVLDHGLTVITDKPLLGTVGQCDRLLARVGGDSPAVFTIFNYTGYPAVREMRQRIAQGQIGRVFKIMAEMPQDSYMRLQNQGKSGLIQTWRLQDGEIPCLSLDLFVHLHSLVHFLTHAAPREVRATARSISGVSAGLIDEVDALIACDGDLHVNAWYGKAALGVRNGLRIRVFGTQGSMAWYQEEPESIRLANADGDVMLLDRISVGSGLTAAPRYNRFKAGHPAGFIEAFANYYWDIAEAMSTGQPNEYTLSLATAAEGIALCDAIARASAEHRVVAIEDLQLSPSPAGPSRATSTR